MSYVNTWTLINRKDYYYGRIVPSHIQVLCGNDWLYWYLQFSGTTKLLELVKEFSAELKMYILSKVDYYER